MGRSHNTDNAEMESFFHTLKGELIKGRHFYGELYSSLNYLSPVEYKAVTV